MTFEKYLEQVCFEANPEVLDDDMPDFFDNWLGGLDGEDYIRLADEYAEVVSGDIVICNRKGVHTCRLNAIHLPNNFCGKLSTLNK